MRPSPCWLRQQAAANQKSITSRVRREGFARDNNALPLGDDGRFNQHADATQSQSGLQAGKMPRMTAQKNAICSCDNCTGLLKAGLGPDEEKATFPPKLLIMQQTQQQSQLLSDDQIAAFQRDGHTTAAESYPAVILQHERQSAGRARPQPEARPLAERIPWPSIPANVNLWEHSKRSATLSAIRFGAGSRINGLQWGPPVPRPGLVQRSRRWAYPLALRSILLAAS